MKNIRLEKEIFIKLMEYIKNCQRKAQKRSEEIADVLYTEDMFISKSDLMFTIFDSIHDNKNEDILMNIIIEAMDDKDNEWINYYVYELDWGEENNKLKVYQKDGITEIPLTTIEDLWNLLISERSIYEEYV